VSQPLSRSSAFSNERKAEEIEGHFSILSCKTRSPGCGLRAAASVERGIETAGYSVQSQLSRHARRLDHFHEQQHARPRLYACSVIFVGWLQGEMKIIPATRIPGFLTT
jgi:hypothetical protein